MPFWLAQLVNTSEIDSKIPFVRQVRLNLPDRQLNIVSVLSDRVIVFLVSRSFVSDRGWTPSRSALRDSPRDQSSWGGRGCGT